MTTAKHASLKIDIDVSTGDIKKAFIDRDGTGAFQEIELDREALVDLLNGGDSAIGVLANRTGPDPRRL